jgi:uncharacterized phage protein gp47/JayE
MPALLDSNGLQIPTLAEIQSEIVEDWKSDISETLNVSETAVLGQIAGAVASQIREAYELIEAAFNARDPDQAEGFALVGLAALTGTIPRAADASYVPCTVDLDAGTYAIGSLIAHVAGDPTKRFANASEIVSVGAPLTLQRFTCEETGPVSVNTGTLTTIAESVTGWNSITNTADTSGTGGRLGSEAETDTELRARRESELTRSASTTVDAIRVAVLDVGGVESCTVLENVTDATDANGLPPHSVGAVVRGGTAAGIAAAIWGAKAAGIATYGSTTQAHVDDQGVSHDVEYSEATEIPLYASVLLTAVEGEYPGDDAVKAALVAEFGAMQTGKDVKIFRLVSTVMGLPGVVDLTGVSIDVVDPPVTGSNTVIAWDEYGNLELADIDVTSTLISGHP